MVFKRREKRSFGTKLRQTIWPKMGWVRAITYFAKRTVRLSDSSQNIAIGLANGTALSFSPFIGTHIIQAGALTYIMRGNVFASVVGTIIGNPWTFPFMWLISISLGAWLFGLFGLPAEANLPEVMNWDILVDLIFNEPMRIFLPWLLGGYLCALISWPISYFIYYYLIHGAKQRLKKIRQERIKKRNEQ